MLQTIIIVLGVLIDQVSKVILTGVLQTPGNSMTVIPGLFDFTYVQNFGAAMGMFQNMRWILVPLTAIVIAIGIIYLIKKKPTHMIVKVTVSMLIAGGIGNLIDRIVMPGGFVRDFFEFTFIDFYVFNFADALVTVGAAILAVYLIWNEFSPKRNKTNHDKQEKIEQGETEGNKV